MLAHEENGVLMLTPVWDVKGTDLRAGGTDVASRVFAKLQPDVAPGISTAQD
jgi:hypothetical protein